MPQVILPYTIGEQVIALVRDEMYRLAVATEDPDEQDTFHDAGDALADALDILRGDQ